MSCGSAGVSTSGNKVFDAIVSTLYGVSANMTCAEAKLVWAGRISNVLEMMNVSGGGGGGGVVRRERQGKVGR